MQLRERQTGIVRFRFQLDLPWTGNLVAAGHKETAESAVDTESWTPKGKVQGNRCSWRITRNTELGHFLVTQDSKESGHEELVITIVSKYQEPLEQLYKLHFSKQTRDVVLAEFWPLRNSRLKRP